MYGLGSTPGSRPRSARDAGADEHDAEPQRHPRVEAALEEIEGQRAGRDEEDEDPDRPVIESVIKLVALTDLALGSVLDGYGGHVCLFLGLLRGKYTPAAYIACELLERNTGRDSEIERVDVARNRNPDSVVGRRFDGRRKALSLCADE